jgi:hypothetical protein
MASKRKEPPTPEDSSSQKPNTSDDFVYYEVKKLYKIPSTGIGKRPTYKFFIDFDDGTGISR